VEPPAVTSASTPSLDARLAVSKVGLAGCCAGGTHAAKLCMHHGSNDGCSAPSQATLGLPFQGRCSAAVCCCLRLVLLLLLLLYLTPAS
jgi:hypothetical protein